jgi:hypothetical protein
MSRGRNSNSSRHPVELKDMTFPGTGISQIYFQGVMLTVKKML